jgi:AhpC/TSA family
VSAPQSPRDTKGAVGADPVGELAVGRQVPDFELLDHARNQRRLSQLVGGDPTVLHFYRGWRCPKEQAFFRRLLALQADAEVAYARIVSVSVDLSEVIAAFIVAIALVRSAPAQAPKRSYRALGRVAPSPGRAGACSFERALC